MRGWTFRWLLVLALALAGCAGDERESEGVAEELPAVEAAAPSDATAALPAPAEDRERDTAEPR